VTGVYFGMKCDQAIVTSIVKLLNGMHELLLYQIYPRDDSFLLRRRSLDRDEIEACGIRRSPWLMFEDVIIPK
jgi:hypothetical protein